MPIHADELSRFFDSLYSEMRKQWERAVDRRGISEWSMQQKEIRMDEIGMILRTLGEGHAVLTYQQPEQREPAPMIWLPRMEELMTIERHVQHLILAVCIALLLIEAAKAILQ